MGKLLTVAIAVVLFVVLVCAALYLETLLVEAIWNELIADSMGWKPLTRDAAFGIVIFSGSLPQVCVPPAAKSPKP